jgi:hypothetical protein
MLEDFDRLSMRDSGTKDTAAHLAIKSGVESAQ